MHLQLTSAPANENTLRIGGELERAGMRLHMYSSVLFVHDLANAGKSGKTVRRLTIDLDACACPETVAQAFATQDSFDAAVAMARTVFFRADVIEERAVDVAPAGFKPLTIDAPTFTLKIGWSSARIECKTDSNNLPRGYIDSRTKAAKIRKWAGSELGKACLMKCGSMYEAARAIGTATGVHMKTYCAMD